MHPVPNHDHLTASDREELATKIEAVSPEGRPADPEMGPKRIGMFLGAMVGVMVLIGVLVSILGSRPLGAAIAIFGIMLLAVHPTVWAAILRAKERKDVNKEQAPGEPRSE